MPAPEYTTVDLPVILISTDNNQQTEHKVRESMTGSCNIKGEQVRFATITPRQLLTDPDQSLRKQVRDLVFAAFPSMSEPDRNSYVNDFFASPGYNLTRKGILFRDPQGGLIAASIWDQGTIAYKRQAMTGVYLISFMILPAYQGFGLGQFIAAKVLTDLAPDVLLVTCDQSSSLYAWINLPEKGLVKNFEVYPRLSDQKEIELLPLMAIDFVIHAFRQIYLGVAEGHVLSLDCAIRNLTGQMVRRDLHEPMYDFAPWQKNGRQDRIANALGLTEKDGVLVVFRKLATTHSQNSDLLNDCDRTFSA